VSDELGIKAAELRAKAPSTRDPLFRSTFITLSERLTRLADQEREAAARLAHKISPPITRRRIENLKAESCVCECVRSTNP
jgi:hypothetical protein